LVPYKDTGGKEASKDNGVPKVRIDSTRPTEGYHSNALRKLLESVFAKQKLTIDAASCCSKKPYYSTDSVFYSIALAVQYYVIACMLTLQTPRWQQSHMDDRLSGPAPIRPY
jgi:hypothetical protein